MSRNAIVPAASEEWEVPEIPGPPALPHELTDEEVSDLDFLVLRARLAANDNGVAPEDSDPNAATIAPPRSGVCKR